MNCIFRRWTPAQISLKSHLNLICINRQHSPVLEATPAGTQNEPLDIIRNRLQTN